jgi:hypothetical protein
MKYMLMMLGKQAEMKQFMAMPPEDIHAHIQFMHRFNKELMASGELVTAEGLTGPEQAKVVRAGKDGLPAVTDGPFPEAKEFLAGYWIIDCETPERAYEIAAKASTAPGRGGVPLNIPIEVRQVGVAPKTDM